MYEFVRPATWTFDQPLFRSATADEDRLEAMLASIALVDESLWVVECNQRPVAFAWTRADGEVVQIVQLYAAPGTRWTQIVAALVGRIETADPAAKKRLELAVQAVDAAANDALLANGFRRAGQAWVKTLADRLTLL